jgi:hypothetical protein
MQYATALQNCMSRLRLPQMRQVTVQMIAVRSSSILARNGLPSWTWGFFSKISQKMALFENTLPISANRPSAIRC